MRLFGGLRRQGPHPPAVRIGEALVERGLVAPADVAAGLELQSRSGERLGRILVAHGLVRRRALYQVLADLWGHPFVDLVADPPDGEAARRCDLRTLLEEGWIPRRMSSTNSVVVATCERPTADLRDRVLGVLGVTDVEFEVTTDWDIRRGLMVAFQDVIDREAAFGLLERAPEESAYTVFSRAQFMGFALAAFLAAWSLFQWPVATLIVMNFFVNIGYLTSVLFKFGVSLAGARYELVKHVSDEDLDRARDVDLPTYTVLVPVYREANVIGLLMENLADLDYPPEKLEILVLLEEDDHETLEAAKAAGPPETVQFVVVGQSEPKTKPKACNVGLFLARGDFVVIYDAEDRPEPDQLKKAVLAFAQESSDTVCVQAALNYFNANENFLTRMFTLEYSFWFDYMLPGLDALRLPIPLGGTSNHFRADALRELGGWDPFNVTEDADLGVRAAARGYRVGIIESTTYEEANSRLGNWIRQRSRWVKGYMQTALVHARHPVKLVRRVGLKQALGFGMLVAGTPLTFLMSPILWGLWTYWIFTRSEIFAAAFPAVTLYISMFNLLIGNMLTIYLGMLAIFKRRQFRLVLAALLNPVYWLLHSVAAYKALGQLVTRPFYWEKTEHGLTRHDARRPAADAASA